MVKSAGLFKEILMKFKLNSNKNKIDVSSDSPADIRTRLQDIIKGTVSTFGKKACMLASDVPQITYLPTGIFVLDYACLGGIPELMITQIVGWESSGKTLLVSKAIQSAQIKYPNRIPVMLDIEGTFDRVWAQRLGVKLENMLYVPSIRGEQAVDIVTTYIREDSVSLIGVDSIPALLPCSEAESSAEDDTVALQARLMAKMSRKMVNFLCDEKMKTDHVITAIVTNQYGSAIGGGKYGNPVSMLGGRWTKYGPALTIECKKKEIYKDTSKTNDGIKDGDRIISNEHAFVIKKSKIGQRLHSGVWNLVRSNEAGVPIGYIEERSTVWDLLTSCDIIHGGGKSFKIGQSKNSASKDDYINRFFTDINLYRFLQACLILRARKVTGVPLWPPDGYLCHLNRMQFNKINIEYKVVV